MSKIAIPQLTSGLNVLFHPIGYSQKREAASPEYIKNLGLPDHFIDKIQITSSFGDLVMFQFIDSYIPPLGSSIEKLSEFDSLSSIRGWVFNIRTKTLVARSVCEDRVIFGPTDNLAQFQNEGFSFLSFVEGTVIRFLYNGSGWISLTQRRINAHDTKIPETNLKVMEIIEDVCPDFSTDLLDTSMVYVFMVVHPQNQIMNRVPVEESLIFVDNLSDGQSQRLDPKIFSLPGMKTFNTLSLQDASAVVNRQEWILMKRGNHLFRYGLPQMTHLMRVRYIEGNPYFPPYYLWLANSPEDRQYLPYAVSHVMKSYVTQEFMTQWCNEKANSLVTFLTMCNIAFADDVKFKLNYDIRKICIPPMAPTFTGDRTVLKIFYTNYVSDLLLNSPLVFYRTCKRMDTFNSSFHKSNLVKLETPDGPVIVAKSQNFSLPQPDFKNAPTPKEASQIPQKPKQNIKKKHRAAKKRVRETPVVSLSDILAGMNLNQ